VGQPVVDQTRDQAAARLGSVVVEQLLGADRAALAAGDTFTMPASIAPVSVRAAIGDRGGDPTMRSSSVRGRAAAS
jgi:hypothetical protein